MLQCDNAAAVHARRAEELKFGMYVCAVLAEEGDEASCLEAHHFETVIA